MRAVFNRTEERRTFPFVGGAVQDRGVRLPRERAAVPITNPQAADRVFLQQLYSDPYFPDRVLDKGRAILVRLCERIEAERPGDIAALYALTRGATEEFNALEEEFAAEGSGIETVAREKIVEEFWFVATAYGFTGADPEKLVAGRNW